MSRFCAAVISLSQATGCPRERIEEYVDAGLLDRAELSDADAMAVRLIESLEQAGVPISALSQAAKRGELSFAFARNMMAFPVLMTGETYGQLISRLGVDADLASEAFVAARLPRFDPDKLAREDEARFLGNVAAAHTAGVSRKSMTRYLRVLSQSLRRIVEAQRDLFQIEVEEPLLARNLPIGPFFEAVAIRRRTLQQIGMDATQALLFRVMENIVFENIATRFQSVFASGQIAQEHLRAVAFVDLTDFTDYARRNGDTAGVELASRLDETVHEVVWHNSGRIVKSLGDGVLLLFENPFDALPSLIEIRARVRTWELLPVHFGVAAGRVIIRDGDVFGTTVNRASRLLKQANPWQILADENIRDIPAEVSGTWIEDRIDPVKGMEMTSGYRWAEMTQTDAVVAENVVSATSAGSAVVHAGS